MAKHKRYHQSKKDRRHESRGEHEFERRHEAMREDGMINEDRSAVANMPQNVMMKPYPSYDGYMPEEADDTMHRIDEMMHESDNKIRAHIKPRKA